MALCPEPIDRQLSNQPLTNGPKNKNRTLKLQSAAKNFESNIYFAAKYSELTGV